MPPAQSRKINLDTLRRTATCCTQEINDEDIFKDQSPTKKGAVRRTDQIRARRKSSLISWERSTGDVQVRVVFRTNSLDKRSTITACRSRWLSSTPISS